VTDARNGTTFTSYNAADQPEFVTTPNPGDGQGPQTTQTFYDTSGRTIGLWLPDGATTTNEYHLTGLLKRTYGSRSYPVGYGHDAQGRMTSMTNWSGFAQGSGARLTTWTYDANRGWLANKRYPDATGPDYTYQPSGRLQTRFWARGNPRITTTYSYNTAGDLAAVTYASLLTEMDPTMLTRSDLLDGIGVGGEFPFQVGGDSEQEIPRRVSSRELRGFRLRVAWTGASHSSHGTGGVAVGWRDAWRSCPRPSLGRYRPGRSHSRGGGIA
jgi:YD repeat-containing protein